MNKYEVKKLFWKVVNIVEECSDTYVSNATGVVIERGMNLSNGCSVLFGLDDSVLRIYDENSKPIMHFTEDSKELVVLKELFEIERGE